MHGAVDAAVELPWREGRLRRRDGLRVQRTGHSDRVDGAGRRDRHAAVARGAVDALGEDREERAVSTHQEVVAPRHAVDALESSGQTHVDALHAQARAERADILAALVDEDERIAHRPRRSRRLDPPHGRTFAKRLHGRDRRRRPEQEDDGERRSHLVRGAAIGAPSRRS